MYTRREFIKNTFGAGAIAYLAGCPANTQHLLTSRSSDRKPNILWIISEDTSPDMGCYGNPTVKTPNIDGLAREGARFANAFVTCPVCSPARSALMTGMYQTSIDAHQHRSHRGDGYRLPEPVKVITEYFRQAGYFTCNCAGLNYNKPGKTDFNFKPDGRVFDGSDWSQRKHDQPFFAQVNLSLTHRAFRRDKQNPIDPAKVNIPPYYPDHPLTRRDWADYLESIQILDRQIGQVLKRLADEGLADNTIVFYFGDHGRPHVRGKQWLYEGGIKIPLIARWPGRIRADVVVDKLVSSIDFAPTCMALANIKPPEHLQGQIFLGPGAKERKYIFAARDRCDETADHIRCVRTKRYKYIRNFDPDRPYTQFNDYKKQQYPILTLMQVLNKQGKLTPAQKLFMASQRPKEELYDLSKDPYEVDNLAGNAKYRKKLRELRDELDRWIIETNDMGQRPEDEKIAQYWNTYHSKRHRSAMQKRGLGADYSDEEYLQWWRKRLLQNK